MNEPRRFSVGVEPDQEEDDQGFHDPQAADARVVEGSRVHLRIFDLSRDADN